MTTERLSAHMVCEGLSLTQQQLPMLSTLCGTIYLPHFSKPIKDFYKKLKPKNGKFWKIPDLVSYVKHLPQRPSRVNDYETVFDIDTVAKDVFGEGYTQEEMNTIKNGLAIYKLNFTIPTVKDPLMCKLKRYDRLLYKLLCDEVFCVRDIIFIDFQNYKKKAYDELICPLLQRMLGVLCSEDFGTDKKRAICMKFSHSEPYDVTEMLPMYPPANLRIPFKTLYEDRSTERAEKWQLLMWILGLNVREWENVKNLDISKEKFDFVVPVCTLYYLVKVRFAQERQESVSFACLHSFCFDFSLWLLQQEELSIVEADAILYTEYQMRHRYAEKQVTYSRCLNGRFVRIAHLYLKMYEWICGCFRACGLPGYSVSTDARPSSNLNSLISNVLTFPLVFRLFAGLHTVRRWTLSQLR